MKTYNLDVFDSHNTCYPHRITARNMASAINKAKKNICTMSGVFKVIVNDDNRDFAEIEGGKVVSASRASLLDMVLA